jgi:cell division septum initiation protein DivIVA
MSYAYDQDQRRIRDLQDEIEGLERELSAARTAIRPPFDVDKVAEEIANEFARESAYLEAPSDLTAAVEMCAANVLNRAINGEGK